jgi:hypothetical protein
MSSSLVLYPHGLFLADFEEMMREAQRQEKKDSSNAGEFAAAMKMKLFYEHHVFPAIRSSKWVFESAEEFAEKYALDCFRQLKLSGKEIYEAQKRLHSINNRVRSFLANPACINNMANPSHITLSKASDFSILIDLGSLSNDLRKEAAILLEDAIEQEDLHMWVILRGIRDLFEINLPRIMYVVRRAIKYSEDQTHTQADSRLIGISESLDWYDQRIGPSHLLAPVLGDLRSFYKVVRNVASHHQGLSYDSKQNEITLTDKTDTLVLDAKGFQQRFRLLVYFCEFGLRGILYAFCEQEKGALSDDLIRRYANTFPEDFPEGTPGRVKFYVQE